jgi:hypothetical protein
LQNDRHMAAAPPGKLGKVSASGTSTRPRNRELFMTRSGLLVSRSRCLAEREPPRSIKSTTSSDAKLTSLAQARIAGRDPSVNLGPRPQRSAAAQRQAKCLPEQRGMQKWGSHSSFPWLRGHRGPP